jgi:hypothetical protein
MSCPHCGSNDVRHSHTSLGLDRIGLRRYRCRTCHGRFWRGPGRHEAVRAQWPANLEAPPDRGAATDLSPLDDELSRKRPEDPRH